MHLLKFLLHDPVMFLPVRGDLPIAADQVYSSVPVPRLTRGVWRKEDYPQLGEQQRHTV
jgi:hypothetical protein